MPRHSLKGPLPSRRSAGPAGPGPRTGGIGRRARRRPPPDRRGTARGTRRTRRTAADRVPGPAQDLRRTPRTRRTRRTRCPRPYRDLAGSRNGPTRTATDSPDHDPNGPNPPGPAGPPRTTKTIAKKPPDRPRTRPGPQNLFPGLAGRRTRLPDPPDPCFPDQPRTRHIYPGPGGPPRTSPDPRAPDPGRTRAGPTSRTSGPAARQGPLNR